MTPAQRAAVTNFCILEQWPMWIMARIGGDHTAAGRDYSLLRKGLNAIAEAVRAPAWAKGKERSSTRSTPQAANESISVANDQGPPPAPRASSLGRIEGKSEHIVDLAFTDADTGAVIKTVRVERRRRWTL